MTLKQKLISTFVALFAGVGCASKKDLGYDYNPNINPTYLSVAWEPKFSHEDAKKCAEFYGFEVKDLANYNKKDIETIWDLRRDAKEGRYNSLPLSPIAIEVLEDVVGYARAYGMKTVSVDLNTITRNKLKCQLNTYKLEQLLKLQQH